VLVDEAGFYLLPMSVRTYAPCGQTPILRVPLTRDHLSAISGITPDGKLYMMVQDTAFDGPAIVHFLRHLLRHIPGQLLLIWDGLPAIVDKRLRTSLLKARPIAFTWNLCPAMPLS